MEKIRPMIGIVPLVDAERDSYWMLPGYMEGILQAGGVPVMLPLTDDPEAIERIADSMDGILFSGGHDVSPLLYREEVLPVCAETCPGRDAMEKLLLPAVLKRGKAVLGICRGIQLINVLLGGTLYQDLAAQYDSEQPHRMKAPYDVPFHGVDIVEGTPLRRILGKERTGVNSCHHQAIKDLAPGLKPMAYSEDGLIEAVYMPEKKFVWAFQWHPEFSYKVNDDSVAIFRAFVEGAAQSVHRGNGTKKLYLIGGTMGVGKTTTAKILNKQLPDSVFLDGDWCWDMHPFQVTDETKKMVLNNIRHLLGNFLTCSTIQNVVFCWVMHAQTIIDDILSGLPGEYEVVNVSLVCSPEKLRERLEKDVLDGKRTADVIERSLARMEMFDRLDTVKLDVSEISPEEAAERLAGM